MIKDMSNKQNDQLKDRAWDLAVSMFDVTAPNEVISEVAEKLYQEMLQEDDGQFTPDEPETYLKGNIVPMTRTQLLHEENRFLNSFSGDENYTFNR